VIDFLFISEEPAEQASSSLQNDGHEILAVETEDATIRVRVRKAGLNHNHPSSQPLSS